MAVTPGYSASIYIGGTSTAFTGEAFTNTSGDIWQIDAVAKRAWDPEVVPDFFDDVTPIDPSDIDSIDYFFGVVTFSTPFVGPITADGSYIPLLQIAHGYEYTVSLSVDDLDCTEFGDTAHRISPGLADASGSMSVWDIGSTDQDPGGGTRTLEDVIRDKTLVLFSVNLTGGVADIFRTWGYITSGEEAAGVADLIKTSIEWTHVNRFDADGKALAFSIGGEL